ncbi:hypothetical protein CLU79DRAFT_696874 [Phycomyces nitens]|nr:hypothetical protein CLU79DRAFT_696874 [Phycomyces nitens]
MVKIYGDSIAVTASTGIAAFHISGTTLHSFAGVGLGKKSVTEHTAQIMSSQTTCERWRTTRTLIIDESKQRLV